MKEQIRDIVAQSETTMDASLLVREYLQARVLLRLIPILHRTLSVRRRLFAVTCYSTCCITTSPACLLESSTPSFTVLM